MHEMQVGFEFEFGSKLLEADLAKAFTRASGYTIGPYNRTNYNNWSIHDDYSVYRRGEDGCIYTAELVSPPQTYEKAIADLEMTLNFMKEVALTCYTSGLHINMSFADRDLNPKLNPLELLFSIPENDLLKSFGRDSNGYCQSLTNHMSRFAGDQSRYGTSGAVLLERAKRRLEDFYAHGSYAMEFGKLLWSAVPLEKRYIEFRITGGKNYQNRFADIRDTIDIYRQAMAFSLNRNDDFVLGHLNRISQPKRVA